VNKEIKLSKNVIFLFIVNLFIVISMFCLKYYYNYKMYEKRIINMFLIINIIFLIFGIVYNVFLLLSNKKDDKVNLLLIVTYLVIYILLNTFVIYVVNKPLNDGYRKNSLLLYEYCDINNCENYYNVNHKGYRDFIIKNKYFDYNNKENDIIITIKYNYKNIVSINAVIYSDNDMFSEKIIKEQLDKYFVYFKKNIQEDLIRKAFDERFNGKVTNDGISYKVSEIIQNNKLISLKTNISTYIN